MKNWIVCTFYCLFMMILRQNSFILKTIRSLKRIRYEATRGKADNSVTIDETYKLLDSGDGMKLEKFGKFRIKRPSQFSLNYKPRLPQQEWDSADFQFENDPKDKSAGVWKGIEGKNLSDWTVKFEHVRFNLTPHEGGQIGIFPEQMGNWKWLSNVINTYSEKPKKNTKPLNILNGFAYSGGSTLACLRDPNVLVRASLLIVSSLFYDFCFR
jgi:23S rRNA G2069 N7-methylase RlmK/C1962 C5-methylase RlmI